MTANMDRMHVKRIQAYCDLDFWHRSQPVKTKKFICVFILLFPLLILSHSTEGADKFGACGLWKFGPTRLRTACEMVRDADIGCTRRVVRWNEVMDDAGNVSFETLDRTIKIILNKKIEMILTLRSIHELFAPDSGKIDVGSKKVWRSAPPAPEYLPYYEAFVREIVERYDGDGFLDASFVTDTKNIKYWQVEVEPGKNPDKGSNFWKGTAQDYAELYLFAYPVIKNADPRANVALSAFTWASMNYYKNHGISFPMEVLRILDERGGDFDIFDVHFYRDYKRFLEIDNALHVHLDAFDQFSDKPIWVTETNVDKNQMDPYFSPEEYNRFVAKDLVKRYCILFGLDIQKVFWFGLSERANATWSIPMEPSEFGKFTGLTDTNFNPKPVYYTHKLLIEKIGGKKTVRRMRRLQPDSHTWIYKFGRNDRSVYLLWYDNPDIESSEVTVPLPWDQVLITRVITEAGVTEPQIEVRPTSSGKLQIILDDSPVFVEKYDYEAKAPVPNAGPDITIIIKDQNITVVQGTASDPNNDPLTYRWLEGENELSTWQDVQENGEACLDLSTVPNLSEGDHTVSLEVDDGQIIVSDEMVLTVFPDPKIEILQAHVTGGGGGTGVHFYVGDMVTYNMDYDITGGDPEAQYKVTSIAVAQYPYCAGMKRRARGVEYIGPGAHTISFQKPVPGCADDPFFGPSGWTDVNWRIVLKTEDGTTLDRDRLFTEEALVIH
jgi:hypothetical protein